MTEGFILDSTDHARLQSEWIEGPPDKSRWMGTMKVKGRARLPVATFRCSKCGYLESFAPSG
jgi:hypothetical protein